MRYKLTSILFLFILLLSACAQPTPAPAAVEPQSTVTPVLVEAQPSVTPAAEPTAVIVSDARGKTYEFTQSAQKIISLAPSNTEILFAVGAGAQVVGRDPFSDYPAEAQSLPDVGGGFSPLNTEVILAAQPDLVLLGELTPAEQIQAIEDLGLTVFVLGNPTTLAEMYENLRLVAKITGHEQETEILVASLQAREEAVNQKLAAVTERPLVLYELDGTDPNAPWIPGSGTFIDTLITQAGGDNLGASLDGAWVQVSLEVLLEKDPALIILGDYTWGGVTPEMVAARNGWDALTAVQQSKVYTIDDNMVSRPGPRMLDGLEALAKFIHPDLFE